MVCIYTGGSDVRQAETELDVGVHKVVAKLDDAEDVDIY